MSTEGFTAFLLVPVAAVIAMVTLIGLPIGFAAALLFALALYAAKLPIAVWIGDRLLGLTGRPGASPYAVEMATRKGLPTILQVASSCSLRSAADMFRSADSDT